ncbi:MAG TPA: NDP-sugar synthase [Pseudobdellovibrionaceae bacterium]|jgi:mannose-1-phosphate guanylyltransferase
MNVMLLAAGEGTRLRPYTLIRPKPAIPFLNIPLASYSLAFLEDTRIDRLVVNTFHLPTKIVDLFIHMNHGARRLHFSHEIHQLLGSGGGLGAARDYFKATEDLILMNADEVILPLEKGIIAKAIEQHQKNKAFCTLLTIDHEGVGTQFGGVWVDHKNRVRGFGKKPPGIECVKGEHFVGIQILSGKVFEYLPNGYPSNILYDVVTRAIQDDLLIETYKIPCHWYETGNLQDFLKATENVLNILTQPSHSYVQERLLQTLEKFSKEAPIIRSENGLLSLRTASSVIENNVTLSGFAVLGPQCKIKASSKLKNVVVADHVQIAEGTEAQDLIFLQNN